MKPPEGETPIDRCARLAQERDAVIESLQNANEALWDQQAKWDELKDWILKHFDSYEGIGEDAGIIIEKMKEFDGR